MGIICDPGIICGAVWGSFAVLGSFSDPYNVPLNLKSRRSTASLSFFINSVFSIGKTHKGCRIFAFMIYVTNY